MAPAEKPILFHYAQSIYSHRVLWYLWLRGLEYDECIQPPVMPRPDLAAIGVNYRRMPLMAIGKDIYIDSRMIISKLESLYPNSPLSATTAEQAGLKRLFEHYSDSGLFNNAVKLMPYWSSNSLVQNKTFLDDRQKLMGGRRMTAENMQAGRPEGLQNMRQAFELMENTFLADGRQWILGTEKPTVADIDAVWPFEWLVVDRGMEGALPEERFGETIYPKTHAWIQRFMGEVKTAKEKATKPKRLDGHAMSKRVLDTTSPKEPVPFDNTDPLGFKPGDTVVVYPSDYGQAHKDHGALTGLTSSEVVIRNSKGLHLHFPRWNFRIVKAASPSPTAPPSNAKKLPKMRLIYHSFSPYTRKVFMLAHELNLAPHITLEKVVVAPIQIKGWSDNSEDVAKYNPMGKIPCLVTDDVPTGIFDSRVICEYLSELAGVKPKKDARYWQMRALHACADGIMDAAVLIAYEVRIRKARGLYFEEWVEGQKTKILRALDRLEAAAKEGVLADPGNGTPSVDEIAVAVATAMTEHMPFLGFKWRKRRPQLQEWMSKWETRSSFVATPPTKDWFVEGAAKL
ncbi:glutathione S-transferase [Stagonosporopsis vannaccii]|nr:glutathione S-transferase [Stagonosporopsis vannaccii]